MKAKISVILAILVGHLSSSIPAHATSHEIKQQKLIETAKKEGTVNLIAPWPPKPAGVIFGAFKKVYPFIQIRQTLLSGREGFERIRAEFASGRRSIDLVNASVPEYDAAGMLQPWKDWFDTFPDVNKRRVHPSFSAALEPQSARALTYRTDLVPQDLQPLTYAKLSDPRFSNGKMAVNIRQYYYWGFLYPKWSDEEIILYLRKVIVPQKPKLCNGSAACWEMLVRGEVWALPANSTHTYFMRHHPKGVRNIAIAADYAAMDEGKPTILLKDAPNPSAAKLFLQWLTTNEAQEIFAKLRGRADPYDPDNVIGAWMKEHGAKLFDHPESAREERSREIGAMFLQLLGLPVPKGPVPD